MLFAKPYILWKESKARGGGTAHQQLVLFLMCFLFSGGCRTDFVAIICSNDSDYVVCQAFLFVES
jgi:hypothetical protein